MRKVSKLTAQAFKCKRPLKVGNSRVTVDSETGIVEYRLHGNCIAQIVGNELRLSNCGWASATTKERLNAILATLDLPYRVFQKQFEWFISGNGELYCWDMVNYFNLALDVESKSVTVMINQIRS